MALKRKTIIGVISGIVCCVSVFLFTQSVQAQAYEDRNALLAQYGGDQVEVCVARRDIQAGETIDSSCLETKMWLADLLPSNAVTDVNEIVGLTTNSSIIAGEVISKNRFGGANAEIEVPSGLVAVSVSAKEVQAVGGAITPGMQVDVYSTGNTSTTCIAQSVLVLSTSVSVYENNDQSTTLNWLVLAVPPESVEELIAAEEKTQLYFALPDQEPISGGE